MVLLAAPWPQSGPAAAAATKPAPGTNATDRLGELVTIPAGRFLMGNTGKEPVSNDNELPQHAVDLPAFEIGKYEVTRGQYRPFIEAGGYEDRRYWSADGWEWKERNDLIFAGLNGK